VAVCLISPLIRQNIAQTLNLNHSEVFELSRFCIHPEYQKKNFASWMISKAIKLFKLSNDSAKVIISYSDSSMGHNGSIYKACGFKLDRIVRPDYWYVDSDGFVMHKRTLYGRAVKMSLTENEYAKSHGYRKVFGSSKSRFVKNIY
jgi:GNAT superfamily N-acetyltransferase